MQNILENNNNVPEKMCMISEGFGQGSGLLANREHMAARYSDVA